MPIVCVGVCHNIPGTKCINHHAYLVKTLFIAFGRLIAVHINHTPHIQPNKMNAKYIETEGLQMVNMISNREVYCSYSELSYLVKYHR